MTSVQLCEAWFQGSPCFGKLMETALEEYYELGYELEHEFQFGVETPVHWAEGWFVPHPIVQNKVVDFILEISLR